MRSVNSARFSPKGDLIALGLSGGYVHVINLKGERLQERKFLSFLIVILLFFVLGFIKVVPLFANAINQVVSMLLPTQNQQCIHNKKNIVLMLHG